MFFHSGKYCGTQSQLNHNHESLRYAPTEISRLGRIFKWFRHNYQWDTATINLVDWDAHLAAIQKLSFSEKRFITKFNFQWLPTGHQQHKIGPAQPNTMCPSCRSTEVEETETHLYQCPCRIQLIGAIFNDLQKFHETEHSAPALLFKIPFSRLSRTKFSGEHQAFSTTMMTLTLLGFARNRPCWAGDSSSGPTVL
jgi:hypothetical protein